MDSLSNTVLIDTYKKAQHLQLEKQFILLLQNEINRRNLRPNVLVKIKCK